MNPVTAAHIHLILCHAPTVAILLALGLLCFGTWRGNAGDQKLALVTIAAAAVVTTLLYLTGEPAEGAVKGFQEFADSVLERHQSVAGLAMAGCAALGISAVAGLLLFRGRTMGRWFALAMLIAGVIVGLLLIWTANLGGQIRHSEIRTGMLLAPKDSR